jgi:SNF2 family DNA or RNA helicase
VQFVRPHYLGTPLDFRNRFQAPITNGQCLDSTAFDVKLMRQRTYMLHERLKGFIHRVDYSHLRDPVLSGSGTHPGLPPKYEYVIFVKLSPLQKKLYRLYLRSAKSRRLFKAYHDLCKYDLSLPSQHSLVCFLMMVIDLTIECGIILIH